MIKCTLYSEIRSRTQPETVTYGHRFHKSCAFISGTPGAYLRSQIRLLGISYPEFIKILRRHSISLSHKSVKRSKLWNISASKWFLICDLLGISPDGYQLRECEICRANRLSTTDIRNLIAKRFSLISAD